MIGGQWVDSFASLSAVDMNVQGLLVGNSSGRQLGNPTWCAEKKRKKKEIERRANDKKKKKERKTRRHIDAQYNN